MGGNIYKPCSDDLTSKIYKELTQLDSIKTYNPYLKNG